MSDYPCNFIYYPITHILSWDGVPESEEYLIDCSGNASGLPNQIIYQGGLATSIPFVQTEGTYWINGKRKTKTGTWGVWGPLELVVVP